MKPPVPMHHVRPAKPARGKQPNGRGRPAAAAPVVSYPQGYFTELIHQHNWPPGFQSAVAEPPPRRGWTAEQAQQFSQQLRHEGRGFANPAMALCLPGARLGPAPAAARAPGREQGADA